MEQEKEVIITVYIFIKVGEIKMIHQVQEHIVMTKNKENSHLIGKSELRIEEETKMEELPVQEAIKWLVKNKG